MEKDQGLLRVFAVAKIFPKQKPHRKAAPFSDDGDLDACAEVRCFFRQGRKPGKRLVFFVFFGKGWENYS